VLPGDAAELESAMSKTKDTFIAKPTGGSQGKGIVLARKWKDLVDIVNKTKVSLSGTNATSEVRQYVVQRYLAQPLLVDGLKFDLRLYVVVTSVVPLKAYLFKEGLARFCTVPYQPPKEGNLQDACMHLTNFAVNKRSKDFQTSESISHHDEGHKRSVSAVFHQIEMTSGAKADEIWGKVASLAANTLMAMRPGLLEFYVHERPRPLHPLGPKGFQIIGLDVIIDSNAQPWLLELNANPSLSAVQPSEKDDCEMPEPRPVEAPSGEAPAAAKAPMGSRRSRSLRTCRARLQGIDAARESPPGERSAVVTSELDLEIKRELVSQALLLARPAPQCKVIRLRRHWMQEQRNPQEVVPLDDGGSWVPGVRPSRLGHTRTDAPDRCPALEALDFEALAAPEVTEYAQAHLSLYRCWRRSCGGSQDTLGQAQMLKLLERGNLIGSGGGTLWTDKVACQLWLSRIWRTAAEGAFGLNLPQFVTLVGRIGQMLIVGGTAADPEDAEDSSHIGGVLEFVRRGLCGPE